MITVRKIYLPSPPVNDECLSTFIVLFVYDFQERKKCVDNMKS